MTDTPQRVRLDGREVSAVVADAGLDLDGRLLSWLDIDLVEEGDHRVTLHLGDGSKVLLSHLGQTHDRFLSDLRQRRRLARFPALTVTTGEPIDSFISRTPEGISDVHLFAKVLVVEPRFGPTSPLPLPLIDRVERQDHALHVRCRGLADTTIGGLGQATDRFLDRLASTRRVLRDATSAACCTYDETLVGCDVPDGWAVTAAEGAAAFGVLRARAADGERAEHVSLLSELAGEHLRLGVYTDGGTTPLPFALAPHAGAVAVEAFDADDRATFVFRTEDVDALNAVLLLTSFRRDALSLPSDRLGRWAVAERTSPAVRWARAALVARVVHGPSWADGVRRALTSPA